MGLWSTPSKKKTTLPVKPPLTFLEATNLSHPWTPSTFTSGSKVLSTELFAYWFVYGSFSPTSLQTPENKDYNFYLLMACGTQYCITQTNMQARFARPKITCNSSVFENIYPNRLRVLTTREWIYSLVAPGNFWPNHSQYFILYWKYAVGIKIMTFETLTAYFLRANTENKISPQEWKCN